MVRTATCTAAKPAGGSARVSSPFFGLNIGASALRTAQTLVDITIRTSPTPTRRLQPAVGGGAASAPFPTPDEQRGTPGQLGTGVKISEVNRAEICLSTDRFAPATTQVRWMHAARR